MDELQKFVDDGNKDSQDPRDNNDKNLHNKDPHENIDSYELHDNMDLSTKWNINDKSDSLSVSSDGPKVEYTGGNCLKFCYLDF